MPIVIIHEEVFSSKDANPGLYGSVDFPGEMLIKTHSGLWFNTAGTELNPKEIFLTNVYTDPDEEEINPSGEKYKETSLTDCKHDFFMAVCKKCKQVVPL